MVVFVERDFAVADSRRDHAKHFFIAFFFSHFKNYLKSTVHKAVKLSLILHFAHTNQ